MFRRFTAAAAAAIALAALCTAVAGASGGTLTKHDRDVLRFFAHHPKLARSVSGAAEVASLLPKVERSLEAATPSLTHCCAVPSWWTNSSVRACIAHNESHNGADPNAGGNIYGDMVDGIWGDYGLHLAPSAGEATRSEQTWVTWVGYTLQGCHGPWGQHDGCC